VKNSKRIATDRGGTFIDFVMNFDGQLRIQKALSSAENPVAAIIGGLRLLTNNDLSNTEIAHGSTVATNAILERKGARTALITTQGFRDVLFIGRQNRPDLYALQPQLPPPLIPREWCYEVPERLSFDGDILVTLDLRALDEILDALVKQQIESVAICLLYSYVNPIHEQMIRDRMLACELFQDWQIALSSDVLPEFREYERASTVALEAYVRPLMSNYIQQFTDALPSSTPLRIMKSDGGVINAERIRQQAVQTVLSGPAAGVLGAFHLAELAGYDRIITMDIGGTSTDVALCPGKLAHHPSAEIDSLPLRIRMLDIETIGAGGGSIARVDSGGALRVGPESAGANPGPMIYGNGGQEITLSDANAILGRLDPDHFLGGNMTLQLDVAHSALLELSQQTNMTVEQTALGIVRVANINIDRALRRVSIARGHDPRDFTLVAFGGAGPLHACEVADQLSIPRVLIPRYPGVLCAFGALVADIVLDYSQSILQPFDENIYNQLQQYIDEMIAKASADLQHEGISKTDMRFTQFLDVRYQGQAYELTIPFTENIVVTFHKAHKRSYGHAMPRQQIEIVNVRLQAIGIVEKPPLEPESLVANDGQLALIGQKSAILSDGVQSIRMYDREKFVCGAVFHGPALVFQMDSTVFISANWNAYVDAYRNLILERIEDVE
jgi:N-methylhydantoinase A